nr:nadp-dependent oxidoreductase red1 [Quercus suber]
MVQNKALIFKEVPTGLPEAGKHLTIESTEFDVDQAPPSGGITAKVLDVSFDPYQRGRMRNPEVKSYSPPLELGKPITNSAILKVIKSDHPKFTAGEIVRTFTNTAEYVVLDKNAAAAVEKLPLGNKYNLDPKMFLGPLGMPGLTAYSSFYEIGKPKKGETILISAASGAVGQLVGQLAKHEGLTVIGSVGDDKKLEFITKDLKFDHGFNYKNEKPGDALKRLAPDGIDIYFESVGGEHLEAAIDHSKDHARIIACGMISNYNLPPEKHYPIRNLMQVVAKRLTIRGFIVGDSNMGPLHTDDHQKNVQQWLHDGSFKAELSVTEGIDNAIEGLLSLFHGKNFGKVVLQMYADLNYARVNCCTSSSPATNVLAVNLHMSDVVVTDFESVHYDYGFHGQRKVRKLKSPCQQHPWS